MKKMEHPHYVLGKNFPSNINEALSHLICTDHSTAGTVFPILEMSNSRLRWFQPLAQNDTISK